MTEQSDKKNVDLQNEDVAAHKFLDGPDADEDTEGHKVPFIDADADADDDTEGHKAALVADDDDVEAHGLNVQPPRDADNQGNQF